MGRPRKSTAEMQAAFCAAVVASGGNVSRACETLNLDRTTPYTWRDEHPDFAEAWDKAKQWGLEVLEDEARRRAFEGNDKPIYYLGAKVDTIREYSDTLAIFLLKGGMPEKYRDNARIEHAGKLTLEQLVTESLKPDEPSG